MPIRVLYTFPHNIGAQQICYTAWEQVRGLRAAGAEVLVMPRAIDRPIPGDPRVRPTLAVGRYRLPYRLFGRNLLVWHDKIVAHRLKKLVGRIDIIHCWPSGSLQTLRTAKMLQIPTVLERPNAHTRFCYDEVRKEYERLGISSEGSFKFDDDLLLREEEEFAAADYLLCPSEFTSKSFLAEGFAPEKLVRHSYGYDETRFFPEAKPKSDRKFCALFVGVDTVRKGLHYALQAWLQSPAKEDGIFKIVGTLSPEFKRLFEKELGHHSVVQLGIRHDVPELMRNADVLFLPSIEEGFGLVCVEALGSGCVPLVSSACTDICKTMVNSMVHEIGDVAALSDHLTMLYRDPALLIKLRNGGLRSRHEFSWTMAGKLLLEQYAAVLESRRTP